MIACPSCPTALEARRELFSDGFGTTFGMVLVPFLLLAVVVWRVGMRGRRALVSSGLLLGAGLGGFVDGIVLHQILQWHNMFSSWHPPTELVAMKLNMIWDGIFHALTWIVVVAGIVRLWRAARRPDVAWDPRTILASSIFGWGLFNVVEGLYDHQLLGIHHVHPGTGEVAWDLGFLVFGALQMAGAALFLQNRRPKPIVAPQNAA